MNILYQNKMSTDEIRSHIRLYKKIWRNRFTTNCYAYALGLDIPEDHICYHAYQPGVISSTDRSPIENKLFSYNTLIDGINSDLDFLNIKSREIHPDEEIAEDEWKISLFLPTSMLLPPYLLDDFHFMKAYPNGYWYHKFGYAGKIINFDDNSKKITNPNLCDIQNLIYDKTLCLKLKK